jgi:hypothetical protein
MYFSSLRQGKIMDTILSIKICGKSRFFKEKVANPHYSSRGEFVKYSDEARSVHYFSQYLGVVLTNIFMM